MSDAINYSNNPLHGVGLKDLLVELVDYYGFEILYAYLSINCFNNNPSIESSIKFLKKADWAREKVEAFYLYQYKSLPRCSDEQFKLSPRDRIIPDEDKPGFPAELSLEDAERLKEKRARKAAERDQNKRRGYNDRNDSRSSPYGKPRSSDRSDSPYGRSRPSDKTDSPYGKPRSSDRDDRGDSKRSPYSERNEESPRPRERVKKTDPWGGWKSK